MPVKPTKNSNSEEKLLKRLHDVLTVTPKKQQLPLLPSTKTDENQSQDTEKPDNQVSTECALLEQFSTCYHGLRSFSTHPLSQCFEQVLKALVQERLSCTEWITTSPRQGVLRVFTCLRMLIRDSTYQQLFFDLGGVKILAKRLQVLSNEYLEDVDSPFSVEILKEMTNICQKLPTDDKKREWLVACGIHEPLMKLLYSTDMVVLHCSLLALIGLSKSEKPKTSIGELNCVEILLRIIESYDPASKKLAANLLRLLCSSINTREHVKLFEGIRICLSLLDSDNAKLLWYLVWIIIQLSEDPDSSDDVRLLGGIPLLLSLIHKDRQYHTEENVLIMSSEGASKISSELEADSVEEVLSLKSAVCTALTELVRNDINAQQIVQANGIYLISSLVLQKRKDNQTSSSKTKETDTVEILQKTALRALRFLFSMERNRQLFKLLFPSDIFETFIDIGHYIKDLDAYQPLVDKINNLSKEQLDVVSSNIEASNKRRAPTRTVGSYVVMELLGAGAFGSVYKVCKKNGDGTCCAMKEISQTHPSFGKTMKERNKSSGSIIQELKIMKEQLNHPNVVKYIKAFQQRDKLYVIMEYIEGAPLTEHFNSLKEKKEIFTEERIWNIFIQIVLGLRYLHKEKHIIHRDLTPNNVMLGSNDKVTITDLGLARQKLPDASELTSVVGTMLYWCPELLQHQPYGDKADVWAAGCLLYQMATLQPPFYSSNLLQLARKIVEAEYEPITNNSYSDKIQETVRRCLTSDPKERPDIVEVAAIISDVMMRYMDKIRVNEISLERKLERERKRTQKHFHEANRNMQNYHRLFWANQERSDKISSLSSSGGYYSIRPGGGGSDGSDSMLEIDQFNPSGQADGILQTMTVHGGRDSNEDGACIDSSPEKCDNNLSPKSDGATSLPVRQPLNASNRGPRRQLMLDMSAVSKNKNILPSLLSPNEQVISPGGNDCGSKRRTQSSSSVEMIRRQAGVQVKARPPTAAATLSISPRKVRQINDPISQVLNQLHKIIFITQLPPSLTNNPEKRIVEKFKRALFSQQTSSFNLKSEIKKVLEGSKEVIDLSFGFDQPTYLTVQNNNNPQVVSQASSADHDVHGAVITYEQMQASIESVLMDSGYYDMSNIKNRRAPLGPIGSGYDR